MTLHALFPTLIETGRFSGRAMRALDARLLQEALQLRRDDAAGRRWSRENYPAGYTSYASANRMHRASPIYASLERRLDRVVARFARSLGFDVDARPLSMSDCWVNIMPAGAAHGLHLHPASTISGTYYLRIPRGAPGLKLEDPRLERFMAAPPREPRAPARGRRRVGAATADLRSWVTLPAQAGQFILFESWLRHEVPMQRAHGERVSVSFNYSWF